MSLRRLIPFATLAIAHALFAQQPSPPLPAIPSLMHTVEDHENADELRKRDYIYREAQTLDRLDKHGNPNLRETSTADIFYLQGVPVRKQLTKNGRPLSPDDLRKQDERIDKDVREALARRAKGESKGEETDPQGHQVVTVSRILELGTFSNPHRILLHDRPTIVVDYNGDPHAKTRNRTEDVIRDLTGTIWIDEQDAEIARMEGQFVRPFKIAGGLFANIAQGTRFAVQRSKIDNAIWFDTDITGSGDARFLLLFNFRGNIHVVDSDFRRFRATSTLLPGVYKPSDQSAAPGSPPPANTPSPTPPEPPSPR